jgi:ABC-2 type transport system permease protein
MAGKIIGNLAVGLFELVIWTIFTVIALKILPNFIPMGDPPEIPFSYILLIVATFLPAFVMIAAAMGAVGATATDMKEAQQVAGFFTLPIVIPYWFMTAIMFNPNGAIAVTMSLIPFTAPLALPMRAVFTTIPFWQLALSVGMLTILAVFAVWLAGRVFRLGMLRYGKKVRLKEAFTRVKAGQV